MDWRQACYDKQSDALIDDFAGNAMAVSVTPDFVLMMHGLLAALHYCVLIGGFAIP